MNTFDYDVVIIGAGPAGSSAAAILADHGHQVLVVERETFPRYHVGESLLPFTYHPLQRLGLVEKLRASCFVKKYSVQFVSPSGKASQPFYFFDRYTQDVAQTYQVLRSDFDALLIENAVQKGARFLPNTRVTELLYEGEVCVGVKAQTADQPSRDLRARMVIDCSGKESFVASRKGWRVKDPALNKVAVWTYYKNAKRDEGIDSGATTVAFVPEKGWFWYIPLHDDLVSVGVVAEGKYLTRDGVKDYEKIFQREIEQNLWIKTYLAPGQQTGPYYLTNEFSFRSRHCSAPGLLLCGDAFGFLDPVFSSGVLLALKSGVLAADLVHEGLEEDDLSPARFAGYAREMCEGIENMRRLVYAFYAPGFSFRQLTDKYPDLAGDITDCLSGDVNKDFTQLFDAIKEFCPLPDPLPYGAPETACTSFSSSAS